MKKNIYILGIICLTITVIATIFKVMHWPGAGILLLVGLGSISLIFLPTAYVKLLKSTNDKQLRFLYTTALISFIIDFIGAIFKIMHWPYAGIFLLIGIPLPFILFLPSYISYHNKRKLKTDINFFAVFLFMIYLGVFSALLAVNPSYDILMRYAHSSKELSKANQYFNVVVTEQNGSEITNTSMELVNQIEEIKQKLVQLTGSDNKKIIQADGTIDYYQIENKDITFGTELFNNADFNSFNQKFDEFGKAAKMLDANNDISRLIEEINDYRIPQSEDGEPLITRLPLITVLNTLCDWQNKLLLISYLEQNGAS